MAATSRLAAARVAGTGRPRSDVAAIRGPLASVPSAALGPTFGLGPLLVERLDEGGDGPPEGATILAMPSLASSP